VLGHYIVGTLVILFASMFILHFLMFVFMPFPAGEGADAPPEGFLRIMGLVFGLFILLGWTFGALTLFAGRCLKRRSRRAFVITMACLNLLFLPLGTLLGVATLMVLTRPSVKAAYGAAPDGHRSR
jgi:hypothetical protein